MENHLDKITVLDELCEKHGTPLWQFPYTSQGQEHISKMCQVCTQEGIALTEQETLEEARNRQRYVTTYDVLMRDSIVPKELRGASFENFKADTAEEKQMLEFAKAQVEKYKQGMTGNTLITGQTGIGKSHLSFAMAIEEEIIRKQALTYIKKLKKLADESESVLKSANKNLTLLQYELYKDAEKTILSNGNVVTRPEKYNPLGTVIEFYRRYIKGTFLERKVD
ncbi:TPA: ATP-binding protein [Streptococcus suis]|uniref:ATP-binding protein n=1 Tax=Streptococcus suis TaxID=1307 RepID=UPI000415D200|nr:ATP-binding protein [Streptococcus suis]HEM3171295.1 ATP-binding protein [Streptococcus suis]HEM6505387.1 ATP-binding protein [Streptococcus suis]